MTTGVARRAHAVLRADSRLHEQVHHYKPEALSELSKQELAWGKKLLGPLQAEKRHDGVPHYRLRTGRLPKLLSRPDGVAIWNKVLRAYKAHAGVCVINMESGHERKWDSSLFDNKNQELAITGLDLDAIDFSEVLLQRVSFVRCSFRGADFEDARMGTTCDPVIFDCCDMEKANFDGVTKERYVSSSHWRYRFDPSRKLQDVYEDNWGSFMSDLNAFAQIQRRQRVAETTQRVSEEIEGTPRNPF